MKFRLQTLTLGLKRETVEIAFSDVSYFWGQMGAGKTSIARLIDYCFGGRIELSPALQSEFVSATLVVSLAKGNLSIERPRDSDSVIAKWGEGETAFQVSIPARSADGEVVPGTGIEVLSDLVFWMSDIIAPRVRRSKAKADSPVQRLSLRNLLWYCYLDQDQIDSSFFHLDSTAGPFQRLPSLDVIRYVIGFHDENVAEIEAQLEALRGERQATSASIDSLARLLKEAGVESELQIQGRVSELRAAAAAIEQEIEVARLASIPDRSTTHAVDELGKQAFSLGQRISANNDAIRDLLLAKDRDTRHLHEIETLLLKFMRSQSARAVLAGVAFNSCPNCTQKLPKRPDICCDVCGQADVDEIKDSQDETLIRRDIKSRGDELRDIIKRHDDALVNFRNDNEQIAQLKRRVERERNEASDRFDTAYLSTMLVQERERASLLQESENVSGMSRFPQMLDAQRDKLATIQANEVRLRISLKHAREDAEKDSSNLETLKSLFLDCLVRASVPGISDKDTVQISPQNFLPEIVSSGIADGTVASFATLSSGGKKTLFKCCFALALHRLAVEVGAPLPEFIMIDSPMKNISERENREQFKGFYNLVYDLKAAELKNTQFILIDKEYTPPSRQMRLRIRSRHMKPGDDQDPPLIPYYRGN